MTEMQANSNPLPIVAQPSSLSETETTRKFRPHIYWYLSFRCNLACKHCSVFSSPYVDTSGDLTTEDAMEVIDQMAELNVRLVILSGGEVLFRDDALEIIQAILDRGLRIGLETNGLLISDEFLEIAKAAQAERMLRICVSLDGGTPETHDAVRGPNTFDKIVANLERMKEHGIRFDLQCILNRANYPSIPNFFEQGRRLAPSLGSLHFGFLNPVGRGTEYVRTVGLRGDDMSQIMGLIHAEKQDFGEAEVVVKAPPATIPPRYLGTVFNSDNVSGCMTCQFPLLGVLPNGDVTICALSRDNEDLFFGNVRDVRLKDIWVKTRMDMLRSKYVAAESLQGICGDCVWQKSCKGGCRAWAYEAGDSFDAPLPLCAMLEEEGRFPKAYRLSEQRKIVGHVPSPEGSILAAATSAGCACS